MELKDKIAKLVYVYDLEKLGIESTPPREAVDVDLSEEVLTNNLPTLDERAATVAWDACFLNYLSTTENGTIEEFQKTLNLDAYKEVTLKIRASLDENVSHERLRELHKRKSLNNPTRVNLKTQVQWDE